MSLDPESPAEWREARRAAYSIVDETFDRLRNVANGPCWQPPSADAMRLLERTPDAAGIGIDAAATLALRNFAPYWTGNLHPRFWGWVMGGGTVAGMLGGWLATALNGNIFGGNQGPVHIELGVIEWFRRWMGFPEGTSGLLIDGGSMGNMLGLAVARHWATHGAVKTEGPEASVGLRLYGSVATHGSVVKAAQLMGLGNKAVRFVRTAPDGSVDMEALEAAVRDDRARGLRPFCVVGSAGTVGVGAIDPLERMAALARREKLWFHVDGAIGALGWLAPQLRPRLVGLDQADSLTFDLHKWGQVPYDAACLLVRDGDLHRATFQEDASYLAPLAGGMMPEGAHTFHAYTPLLSRADRALKIWMTFMTLGTDRIAAMMVEATEQARYLAELVTAEPKLELCAPVALNLACFRYRGSDDLNQRIQVTLQESGFCVMSPYRIADRAVLRVCLSNHRTRRSDLEALVREVVRLGDC